MYIHTYFILTFTTERHLLKRTLNIYIYFLSVSFAILSFPFPVASGHMVLFVFICIVRIVGFCYNPKLGYKCHRDRV